LACVKPTTTTNAEQYNARTEQNNKNKKKEWLHVLDLNLKSLLEEEEEEEVITMDPLKRFH
jgi:hypothetical protein